MRDKSLVITVAALIILASLAILSGFYKWKAEAVAVALMGFTFIVYWNHHKEKQFNKQESRRIRRIMLGEISFNLRIVAQNKQIRDKHEDDVPVVSGCLLACPFWRRLPSRVSG